MRAAVEPPRLLTPDELQRLGPFELRVKRLLEGTLNGRHPSPFAETGGDFADHRSYVAGDETRSIDWRAFARTDRLFVKRYQKETALTCVVAVDCSGSMGYCPNGFSKLDYARHLAAVIAHLVHRQGDRPAVAMLGEGLADWSGAGRGAPHLNRLMATLERAEPGGATELGKGLTALDRLMPRGGQLVVISDFLEDVEPTFDALARLAHRGLGALLVQTLAREEWELPQTEPARFFDLESPLAVTADPEALREAYRSELASYCEGIERRARDIGLSYQLVGTWQPFAAALQPFLKRRRS